MKYFIMIIFLTSCGSTKPWPARVNLENSLPDEIITYAKDLNQNKTIIDQSGQYSIDIIPSEEYKINDTAAGTATRYNDHCVIRLSTSILTTYKHCLKTVIWHEIGHCFGMIHSENQSDIMYKSVTAFGMYSNEAIVNFLSSFKF